MILRSFFKAALVIGAGVAVLSGCGKKTKTESQFLETVRPPLSEVEKYLDKQDATCDSSQACPSYLAKAVVLHGSEFKFCTAFLTDDDVVATSSSCLPDLLRLNGQDCSKDVFFFFPRHNRRAERVNCKKVLQISQLEGQDPLLWRDDVAFLELEKAPSYRRRAAISKDGISDDRSFLTWMIDQQDEFTGIFKKMNCGSVHNNYINPLVVNESSPNMVFSGCSVFNGGTGGPVIDARGKVRGIVSKEMDPKLRTYLESSGLLTNHGLKQMFHATNFACAPTPKDTGMLDERECLKDLNYNKVDRIRAEMLSTGTLFGDMKSKLEETLGRVSRYVQFGVKLIPKGDVQEISIYPKCFKPFDQWLSSLNYTRNIFVHRVDLPTGAFKRIMNPAGKVQGVFMKSGEEDNYVQFSLKSVRSVRQSHVLTWKDGENGARTYPNLTEDCSSSSLL